MSDKDDRAAMMYDCSLCDKRVRHVRRLGPWLVCAWCIDRCKR